MAGWPTSPQLADNLLHDACRRLVGARKSAAERVGLGELGGAYAYGEPGRAARAGQKADQAAAVAGFWPAFWAAFIRFQSSTNRLPRVSRALSEVTPLSLPLEEPACVISSSSSPQRPSPPPCDFLRPAAPFPLLARAAAAPGQQGPPTAALPRLHGGPDAGSQQGRGRPTACRSRRRRWQQETWAVAPAVFHSLSDCTPRHV